MYWSRNNNTSLQWGSLSGVVVKGLKSDIVVRELRYYVHLRTNTFEKAINVFIPTSNGLNSISNILQKNELSNNSLYSNEQRNQK